MDRTEMLKQIEIIQPYIDSLIDKNYVKFNDPATEIPILEVLYNEITGRKYLKFNSGCGSCIKEALIIADNWRKKALKEIATEESAKVVEVEEEKTSPETMKRLTKIGKQVKESTPEAIAKAKTHINGRRKPKQ